MRAECSGSWDREAELKRQGWTRRFVADESRLGEAVELYKSLGYEVRLEPAVFDETSEECKKCLLCGGRDKYKVIYTRPKGHVQQ
ncbi:MAG: hypothetical protein QXW82_02945 [Candidatus Bathyarchaeia archaeon]